MGLSAVLQVALRHQARQGSARRPADRRCTSSLGAVRIVRDTAACPELEAGSVVTIGAYDGVCYAFDVESGETVWRTRRANLDGSIAIGSSPAYWDGVICDVRIYERVLSAVT